MNHSVVNTGCTENQRSQRPIIQFYYCLTLGPLLNKRHACCGAIKHFCIYRVINCTEKIMAICDK